ncbi:MAG: hypothetical protein RMI45_07020 [Ignisphaera sp.]|nr:hypothetical protein [Ignisphaera sp.]MDW8085969.1 hypothetical protein [Ignisphaera sp.]
MAVLWQTGIPRQIYARLYCSWRRARREARILSSIFRRYGARKLIEFGCGIGRHGYLLNQEGFSVLLTDVEDWRFGVARRLPFKKVDILNSDGGVGGDFDGGYAVNLMIIFSYSDMVRALKNISRIIGRGIFVADYNFELYSEPRDVEVRIGGRVYRALLEEERVVPVDGGVRYSYRVKVVDGINRVVGVEEASYPVYKKEVVFKAIQEAGFKILDIVWVTWNPIKYMYELSRGESDSAFMVMVRA